MGAGAWEPKQIWGLVKMGLDKRTMEFFNRVKEFVDVAKKNLYLIGKSGIWFVLTLFFGLYQTWIKFITTLMDKETSFLFKTFITDGVLLFFCMVLISSLTIDYHFFRKTFHSEFVNNILFLLIPLIVCIFCVVVFLACYYLPESRIDIYVVTIGEFIILLITAIYAVMIKFFSLKKDLNK